MVRRKQPPAPTSATAYSYQRFSSPTQADGDSIRRQTELRDAWLTRTGVVLDTSLTLRDEGVSAFTGAHRENPDRNALAAFLELVKRGRIPRGSFLIVESLDRLTREHIRPALTLVLNLIDAGIRVVQLLPVEAVYDEDVDPMQLMQAIMELSRGHSESRMKSERLARAWAAKKKAAVETGTPITRALPAWVRFKDGKLVLVPDKAAAVRRVYELAVAGYGLGAITKKLNTERVPAIGRAGHWARSYVAKLLANRAVFGEFQSHRGHAGKDRKPDGPPVPNYFPAVVTESQWHAARAALVGRRMKGGRPSKRVAIFTGLLRDWRDGGTLHTVNKGVKSSGPALVSYKAAQGVPGTVYVSFPLAVFEAAVLSQLREVDPRDVLPRDDPAADKVAALAGKLTALETRVEKIKAALTEADDVGPVIDVLRDLETKRRKTADELATARRAAASPLSAAWGECRNLLDAVGSAADPDDARTRLRAAVRRVVDVVTCLFLSVGQQRLAVVRVAFRGGGVRVYLIVYRPGKGNASARTPGRWWARSAEFAGFDMWGFGIPPKPRDPIRDALDASYEDAWLPGLEPPPGTRRAKKPAPPVDPDTPLTPDDPFVKRFTAYATSDGHTTGEVP